MRQLKCGKPEMQAMDPGSRSKYEICFGSGQWVIRGSDGKAIATDHNASRAWQKAFAKVWAIHGQYPSCGPVVPVPERSKPPVEGADA